MTASRIFKLLIVTFTMLVLLVSAPGLPAQDNKEDESLRSEVVNGNSQFAIDLYQNINASEDSKGKNIFISPFSISTALAMTYEGSRNNTRKEMASALHFNLPGDKLDAAFSLLLGETKAAPGEHYKLNVANALWGQKDYRFESAFTRAIDKYYDGGFNLVDYLHNTEGSRKTINKWVEARTEDKIKALVHKDDINTATRLVLTNAIYFKGDWASKFKAEKTQNAPFTASDGKTVDVPMMAQSGNFPFLEDGGLAMIELPYAGNDLSMIAILPEGDVEKLGASLSLAKIQELRKNLRPQHVDVYLPRFKFEARYHLDDGSLLPKMGMRDAFSETRADFSGMTGSATLYISHVIHQAVIDVNEEGSEAAAATAVVMTRKSISRARIFRADRPFIFMIVHKPTDSILFLGRLSSPAAAAN